MELATLYKAGKAGITQWSIAVEGSTIITRWGKVGGTIQEGRDTLRSGKNIGRANETTAEQQAQLEAEAKWRKQLDAGYVELQEAAVAGKVSDRVKGGLFPMLAHRFDKYGDKIVYPAFAQPKLDGHRCIGVPEASGYSLWSRQRKPINSMAHIQTALGVLTGDMRVRTDGELYHDEYRDKFEELSHFIKQVRPEPGCEVVQYHVYDAAIPNMPYRERRSIVQDLVMDVICAVDPSPLVAVETIEVVDEDELMLAFERFLAQGYEGAIVRNAAGLYQEDTRSYDLQKVKQFNDAEFEVVGVNEGRGKLAGHAIFDCVTEKGVHFDAKMKGPLEALKEYWEHPDRAIGRQMTVQYQGFFKTGKPRFCVAKRFRDDV